MQSELDALESSPFTTWKAAPERSHPFFGALLDVAPDNKALLRTETAAAKKAFGVRVRELKRTVKEQAKLQAERDQQESEIAGEFNREIEHIHEAAAELRAICADPDEAARYFTIQNAQKSRRTSSISTSRATSIRSLLSMTSPYQRRSTILVRPVQQPRPQRKSCCWC